MADSKTTGAQLRAYLLGLLKDPDREDIEDLLFHDDSLSAKLELAEDELIDDYLSGRLSLDERTNFDRYFHNSTKRTTLLEVAEAVRSYSHVKPSSRPRTQWFFEPFSWAAAAVCIAVVAACIWWWQRPIAPSVAVQAPPREPKRTSPVEPSRPPFALVLTPGLFRGPAESSKKFVIPISANSMLITLMTEAPLSGNRYRVSVTRDDRLVWQGSAAGTAGADHLQVTIPASVLKTGEYSLTVFEGTQTDPNSGLYDYLLSVSRN